MKKLILIFAVICSTWNIPAATVRYISTNVFGLPDTNVLRVTPIGAPIRADGSFVTRGAPWRWYPDATGTAITNMMQGNYLVSNSVLNTNMIFAVPVDSDTNVIYDVGGTSGLAISGFNTYNYSPGIRTLTGVSIEVTNDGDGHFYITSTNGGSASNVSLAPAELFSVTTNSAGNWTGNVGTNEVRTTAQQLFIVSANVAGNDVTNINNLQVTNAMAIRTANVTNWYFFGTAGTGPFLSVSNNVVVLTNAPTNGGGSGTGSSNLTDVGYSVVVRSNMLFTNTGLSQIIIGATNGSATNALESWRSGVKFSWLGTNGIWYGDGSGLTNITGTGGSGTGSSNITDFGYSLIIRSNTIWTNSAVGTFALGKTNLIGATNQVEGFYADTRYWYITTNGVFYGDGSGLTGVSGGNTFELDASGDLMPSLTATSDTYWELDGNGDLEPKL